ncbi:MAG: RsmB/NOP family class I SAM-dependent RNA methyltransferase [Deinococcaceae bacterium]
MVHFPTDFVKRMERLLDSEFPDFLASMQESRTQALRVNPNKVSDVSRLKDLAPLEPVPWCSAGFYVSHTVRAGSHPLHAAGAYYMQEASAMAVAEILLGCVPIDSFSNLKVLDLCAAPGGKASHLAQLMGGNGLLVCNERVSDRAHAVVENLERLGFPGVVLQETSQRLAQAWPGVFDRILVDAPCSGEGMFRKDPKAIAAWNPDLPKYCAERQMDILRDAAILLKPGGIMAYSTCTFSKEENEDVVLAFLKSHPDFRSLDIVWPGLSSKDSKEGPGIRLMPHEVRGEGHYVALLQKYDGDLSDITPQYRSVPLDASTQKLWKVFAREMNLPDEGLVAFKGQIQPVPTGLPSLDGLKVLRVGPALANCKPGRLEPAHGLSHLDIEWPVPKIQLEGPELAAYLRGETLDISQTDGWTLVQTLGLNLGWGKISRGTLKNHYPKYCRTN